MPHLLWISIEKQSIGNVNRDQYLEQVRAACDFLEGQCQEMQSKLESEMAKAAAAQEYEKAAELRDLLTDLRAAGVLDQLVVRRV